MPDHGNNGARGHVLNETREEGLALEVSVVCYWYVNLCTSAIVDYDLRTLLEVLRGSVNELEGDELEATLLEAADDVPDESTLDAIGLRRRGRVQHTGVTIAGETRRTLTMM